MQRLGGLMYPRREIRREECRRCLGAGKIQATGKAACPTCTGIGWIRSQIGQESICPRCRGFQQVDDDRLVACDDCESRGYIVILVELREESSRKWHQCRKCDGSGKLIRTWKDDDLEDCEACGGSGHDIAFGAQHGIPVENTQCSVCHGRRMVRPIVHETYECPRCNGEGGVTRTEVRIVEVVITDANTNPDKSVGT